RPYREGLTTDQIKGMFNELRSSDYKELIHDARELLDEPPTPSGEVRLLQRFENLKKIDYFESPARAELETLVNELKQRERRESGRQIETEPGRVGVTRREIRIDRIASAWLIRKFIDPQAMFRFVDTSTYRHAEG